MRRTDTDLGLWTVGELLSTRTEQSGSQPYIQMVGGTPQTYAQVYDAAMRVAAGLRLAGVCQGDTVVVMLPNRLEAIHSWLGVNLLGAVDVSINTGYRGAPLEHAINQARARIMIVAEQYLPLLQASADNLPLLQTVVVLGACDAAMLPTRIQVLDYQTVIAAGDKIDLPQVKPSDIATVIYTSGTTGPAKGVLMPHAQVTLLAQRTAQQCRMTDSDVFYSFHPLYHMAGKFMGALATMVAGGKLVLDATFSADKWLQNVREYRATVTGAHGPMLEMVYALPPTEHDRDHRLRSLCTAPFPRHIARAFEDRFGVKGMEVWGMTEVGIPCWSSVDEPLREGSCGKVDDDWFDFQVVDPETDTPLMANQVGEFVVRHKQPWTLMAGYMGMPEKTVEAWRNLWFHTGDAGYIDDAGYVYFVDRTADRIRRRAENISSYDIEVAALRHPAIREAAAVGVPSGFVGDDDIKLCVVCHAGTTVDPIDLIRALAERLPHYMVPRYIELLPELPRSATNKVRRAALRNAPYGVDVWDRKQSGLSLREIVSAN